MKSMLYVSSAAALSRSSHCILRNSLHGFSSTPWTRKIWNSGIEGLKLNFALVNFRVCCYSAKSTAASPLPKLDTGPYMKEDCNAFYLVQKGGLVGIYRTLKDCESQICDPLVNVYKGYSMRKEVEEYLLFRGLKNATYSISSLDVTDDIFGTLVPFTDQQSDGLFSSSGKVSGKTSKQKRLKEGIPDSNTKPDKPISSLGEASRTTSKQKKSKGVIKLDYNSRPDEPSSPSCKASGKISKQKRSKEVIVFDSNKQSDGLSPLRKASRITSKQKKLTDVSCFLEFDGASKGNPGKGGAGAILRSEDGSVVWRLCEGLGVVTNNVAEYRAIILGMKCALEKGFSQIRVQGDSELIIKQILNKMKTKSPNLTGLNMEAKELKRKFLSFEINHVKRGKKSEMPSMKAALWFTMFWLSLIITTFRRGRKRSVMVNRNASKKMGQGSTTNDKGNKSISNAMSVVEFNKEADAQANLGANLESGVIKWEEVDAEAV